MSAKDDPVTILSVSECWDLLSTVSLGRLVTSADGHAEIFPLNFAVQNKTVLFRSASGTKLVSAAINNQVLFEADDHDEAGGWSVIMKGTARSLRSDEDRAEADEAQLRPWIATEKSHYVRVLPLSITGRRFVFGPEPGSDSGTS